MSQSTSLRLGNTAPNFKADSTQGAIDFHSWIGQNWVVFTAHPFENQVSTSEIVYLQHLTSDFLKRNAKVIAVAPGTIEVIKKWEGIVAGAAKAPVTVPLVADKDMRIARAYDMLEENSGTSKEEIETVHDVIIIDPEKTVRAIFSYPPSVGLGATELLRVLDALQTPGHVGTPAGWTPGHPILPHHAVDREEALGKMKTLPAFSEGLDFGHLDTVNEEKK